MTKTAVVLCAFFSFAGVAWSQTALKTVTNEDLERYAQERIQADRQYRETYIERGLPSPRQLQAQTDARIKATLELADKIRAERVVREAALLAAEAQVRSTPQIIVNTYPSGYVDPGVSYPYGYDGYYTYGYGGIFGNRSRGRFGSRYYRPRTNNGYLAAGGWLWPAAPGGIAVRPSPLFVRPGR